MSEGLQKRMARIVGDENTVARYLLEKIGHTALIAWTITVAFLCTLPESDLRTALARVLTGSAGAAAFTYNLVGKIHWHREHGGRWGWGDFAFDLLIGAFPAVIALWLYGPAIGTGALLVWVVLVLAGSNNQVGSPS